MKTPNSKLILGALTIGVVIYASLSYYEVQKIKEIQSARPEDQIQTPGATVMFCVNNKAAVCGGLIVILLALASYSGKSSPAPSGPFPEPPAEI